MKSYAWGTPPSVPSSLALAAYSFATRTERQFDVTDSSHMPTIE